MPIKSTTKAKRALLYPDSFGVAFGDVRRWILSPASVWSTAYPMKDIRQKSVCELMHELNRWSDCWLCGRDRPLEAHHVVSRWDFAGNICMVCSECHQQVQHAPAELPRVLRAMWQHNKFLSWVHLVRARGSHFGFDTLD